MSSQGVSPVFSFTKCRIFFGLAAMLPKSGKNGSVQGFLLTNSRRFLRSRLSIRTEPFSSASLTVVVFMFSCPMLLTDFIGSASGATSLGYAVDASLSPCP